MTVSIKFSTRRARPGIATPERILEMWRNTADSGMRYDTDPVVEALTRQYLADNPEDEDLNADESIPVDVCDVAPAPTLSDLWDAAVDTGVTAIRQAGTVMLTDYGVWDALAAAESNLWASTAVLSPAEAIAAGLTVMDIQNVGRNAATTSEEWREASVRLTYMRLTRDGAPVCAIRPDGTPRVRLVACESALIVNGRTFAANTAALKEGGTCEAYYAIPAKTDTMGRRASTGRKRIHESDRARKAAAARALRARKAADKAAARAAATIDIAPID